MSEIQLTHICEERSGLYFPLNMFSFQLSCMQMTAHLIDAGKGIKRTLAYLFI